MKTTLEYYVLLFFASAVLGWAMEVICKLIQFRRFINRGFLLGPYCPIYGFGAVAVTALLTRYADSPALVFVMAVLICGALEYATSYLMEKLFHARWWDYSQRRLNLNGRVCAATLIPFGLLGLAMIYAVKPFLFGLFARMPEAALDWTCIALTAVFAVDCIVSATALGHIRRAAETVPGDSTEALTQAVRERLLKSRLAQRTLRAFPYAQIYNRDLRARLSRARREMRESLLRRHAAMRESAERWEQRARSEAQNLRNHANRHP